MDSDSRDSAQLIMDDLSKALNIFRSIAVHLIFSSIAALLERVFLRVGSADSDEQLESVIGKFLCPVLLKLSSDDETIRKKVMELLIHVNKRVKSRPTVRLPVGDLMQLYADPLSSAFLTVIFLLVICGIQRMIIAFLLEFRHNLHQDGISTNGNSGTSSAFTKTMDGACWEAPTAQGQPNVHWSSSSISSRSNHRSATAALLVPSGKERTDCIHRTIFTRHVTPSLRVTSSKHNSTWTDSECSTGNEWSCI